MVRLNKAQKGFITLQPRHSSASPVDPTPKLRCNRSAMLLFAVTTLTMGHLLYMSGFGGPWLLYPLSCIYSLYITAAILVFTRPVRGWRDLGIFAFVLLFTLLREGKLGHFSVGYDVYSSEEDSHIRSTTYGVGDTKTAPGSRNCRVACFPNSVICREATRGLCNERIDPPFISASVEIEDPFCYVPLYKSDNIHYSISITQRPGRTDVRGDLEQTAIGPMSCLSYRRLIASALREAVVSALTDASSER
jgi:hypothetical protein